MNLDYIINPIMNTEMATPIKPLQFIEDLTSTFYQTSENEHGYNHLFLVKNNKGQITNTLPTPNFNFYPLKASLKNDETLLYKPGLASGHKTTAVNSIVATINFKKESNNFSNLIGDISCNKIARPTHILVHRQKDIAYLVYNFLSPVICGKKRGVVFRAIDELEKRLSNIFSSVRYGGKCLEIKTEYYEEELCGDPYYLYNEYSETTVVTYEDISCCNNNSKTEFKPNLVETEKVYKSAKARKTNPYTLALDFLNCDIFRRRSAYADIIELIDYIKIIRKRNKLGKKAKKAMDELTYIYNTQKNIYHKTKDEEITDKLALQCDNILNQTKLTLDWEVKKPYELLMLYSASLIKANRDVVCYKRSLIQMWTVLNHKLKERYRSVTKEELDDLLNLTEEEKTYFASKYNFKDNKNILKANGMNPYAKEQYEARKKAYAYAIKKNKREENDDNIEYYKNIFARKNRKIKTIFESKVAVDILLYLLENENYEVQSLRSIAKGTGHSKNTVLKYKNNLVEFFENNRHNLKKKKKLRKWITRNFLKAQDHRRRRSVKAKIFEKEYNLDLEQLENIKKLDKILTNNSEVVSTRKKGNHKVFHFIKLGLTVVYNYVAEISQVFRLHQEKLY